MKIKHSKSKTPAYSKVLKAWGKHVCSTRNAVHGLLLIRKRRIKKNRLQKMHYIQVHLLRTLLVHRDTYRTLQQANVQRMIDSRMH